MKLLILLRLAFRYLTRHLRRYLFLLAALAFGFGIVTVITSLKEGMDENVYRSTRDHYAGDLVIPGYDHSSKLQFRITQPDTVLEAIEAMEGRGIGVDSVVFRSQFGAKGILYFNGAAVRHKYVLGVDWENEADYFSSLSYTDGDFSSLPGEGEIIISRPVARELSARVGDRLLLEVETLTGQKNTRYVTVKAVVRDSTIFGYYKCFIDRRELNDLLRLEPEQCCLMGVFLADRSQMDRAEAILHQELSARLPTGPLVENRDELERETRAAWEGIRHFVFTVPVYLSEVAELLQAVELIAYFLYGMMILIILVSVAVTYRLILHERERELATMRAVGFHEPEILLVLLLELLMLFAAGLALGFLIARVVLFGISFLSFSWIPSFGIFMQGGRLLPRFVPSTMARNVGVVLLVVLPVVLFQSHGASRKPLSETLAGAEK